VVQDQHEAIEGVHALDAGDTIHLVAGDTLCVEGADITLRGPGGFIRIDGGGVTISGTMVKINTGGEPMTGRGIRTHVPSERDPARVLDEQLVAGKTA